MGRNLRHPRYSRYQFYRYEPARKMPLGRGFLLATGMTVTAALGLLYLTHTSSLAESGTALHTEERTLARVTDDTEKLRLRAASLRSLERLEASPVVEKMVPAGAATELTKPDVALVDTDE